MSVADEVKQRLDIVSTISDHIQLTKAGRNFKGLCPFHTEKTPSFFVFPDRQTWRCFGCASGGDVISFVMKREGLDFAGALKMLAERTGVTFPEKRPRAEEDAAQSRIYATNEAAAQYYHALLGDSPAAGAARAYVERRGMSPASIEAFLLGFSMNEWDGLKKHLGRLGYRDAELVAAGLAVEKDGRIYDRFRGRLMFPIRNAGGRVVGFGARALDDSHPKYLNSGESPIFSKSAVLYALDRAKDAIRREHKAVIVEGYMDVITAHQAGFCNVIASMGTALTEKHIGMLKGLANHICLSLDADAAGNAATSRALELCREALGEEVTGPRSWLGGTTRLGMGIEIISLPEGKDPDDVIRESPDQWQALIDHAQPLMDYVFTATAREIDLSRPEGKSQLVAQLLPRIAELADSAMRESYLTRLSEMTGLKDEALKAKVADLLYKKGPRKAGQRQRQVSSSTRKSGDPLEEHCLSLILRYPALRQRAGDLSIDHFDRSENREVYAAWQQCRDTASLADHLDSSIHDHLESLCTRELAPTDTSRQEQELCQCIRRLEERRLLAALQAEEDIESNSVKLRELWRGHAVSDAG